MTTPQEATKSQTMRFTLLSKNVFTLEEAELYELTNLTGVIIDQKVFKIILDLLKMNVAPAAIIQMLKHMRSHAKHSGNSDLPKRPSSKQHSKTEADIRPTSKQHTKTDAGIRPIGKQHHAKSDADIAHSARSESGSRQRGSSLPRNGSRSARS